MDTIKPKIPFQDFKFAKRILAKVKIVKPKIDRKKQIIAIFQSKI